MKFIGKCLLCEDGKKKILVVGDLHLGYEEFLNRAGVFVSREMLKEMVYDFEKIFKKIGKVDEVVLLGDVKHDFGTIMRQEREEILEITNYLLKKSEKIIITKGNHDAVLHSILKGREKVALVDFYCYEATCFAHGERSFEEMETNEIKTWVLGHGHPAVKLKEKKGIKVEKYKCFLVGKFRGKEVVVVPSFSSHSEGSDPLENDLRMAWNFDFKNFKVKIVQGEELEVLDFGKLKYLK